MSGQPPTQGKSKLIGQSFRLEGFAYVRHPTGGSRMKIQLTIFSILPDETTHVICMSDVQRQQIPLFKKMLDAMLGETVTPEEAEDSVIPYAQRELDGGDLATIKTVIEDGWKGVNWSWMS